MTLKGEQVSLRPLTPGDRDRFARWTLESEATPFLFGPMTGDHVPTREELFQDYAPYFFDGSQPDKGRCFGIEHQGTLIGQVNYNEIDRHTRSVEIDLWIGEPDFLNRGLGSEALELMAQYCFDEFDLDRCYIIPPAANIRAVRSYEKAGFRRKSEFEERGIQWVYMEKSRSSFCE